MLQPDTSSSFRTRHLLLGMFSLAFIGAVAFTIASPADAVSTRSFILDSAESLAEGELDGTAVHSNGSVTLGAEADRIALDEAPLAYALARGAQGEVFIGSGNEGKIYRLRGDALEVLAETGQLLVSSLVVTESGQLYAGTLPEGRIYRVDTASTDPATAAQELVRPEGAEHIWDLAYSERTNTLFAATGPEGQVFAVDRSGNASVYYDSEAYHVMSLALDASSNGRGDVVYAGTSDEALVVRLRGAGQSEVVYDFPGNEITSLDIHEGALAVAANEFPDPPRVSSSRVSRTSKNRPARPRPGKGRLYRVGTDGRTERIFSNDDGQFSVVQFAEDGAIFVGAGAEGRVYRVAEDERGSSWLSSTWLDVEERQVLDLDFASSPPLLVTGDSAALYRVRQGRPSTAVWTSKVLDAGFHASFGRLTWRGRGTLRFETRSGNTEEPDASWSAWSSAISTPGPIRSPAARFLQIRAHFDRAPDAVLHAVRAFYLPQNQRATIQSVGLKPPSAKQRKNQSPDDPPDASAEYPLAWKVQNPDDDRLRYRLYYRGEAQDLWRPMFDEQHMLTKNQYEWGTSGLPDGFYVVRVEASDELANPEALTLRARAESEPIRIDNHPPTIERLAVRGATISGIARDGLGPIARLEYAVDGGEWRLFFPVDNHFDTREENFEFTLPERYRQGSHIVAIKAYDSGGNTASAEITTR